MTAHAWRLPPGLDPLIGEAKQRMRRRRRLFVITLVVLALGGAAAGLGPRLGGGPPAGFAGLPASGWSPNQALALAKYPGLSFRYPTAWRRHDRCVFHGSLGPAQPLTVLTTSRATGTACAREAGIAPPWPPRIRLGRNGVLVYLTVVAGDFKRWRVTRLGASPRGSYCRRIGGQQSVVAVAASRSGQLVVGACLSGPDFKANELGLGSLLASVRWAGH
jgi:hypothetical protein